MVSPIPQQNEFNIDHLSQDQSTGSTTSSNAHQNRDTHSISTQSHRNSRRAVSESMIEVVQSIAPMLTVEQIRYDLETTGNVEATVNRFMELGDLPFPRIRASTTTTNTKRRTKETRSDWETISEFIGKVQH